MQYSWQRREYYASQHASIYFSQFILRARETVKLYRQYLGLLLKKLIKFILFTQFVLDLAKENKTPKLFKGHELLWCNLIFRYVRNKFSPPSKTGDLKLTTCWLDISDQAHTAFCKPRHSFGCGATFVLVATNPTHLVLRLDYMRSKSDRGRKSACCNAR